VERAAFLKNDLHERFGIVAEVMDEEPKPLAIDLDEELGKLRKIKELLAIESAAASLGRVGGEAARDEDLGALDAARKRPASRSRDPRSDLRPGARRGPETASAPRPLPRLKKRAAGPVCDAETDEALTKRRHRGDRGHRRTEPANGSGEIHYFQKGNVIIADPEKILAAVDRTSRKASACRRSSARPSRRRTSSSSSRSSSTGRKASEPVPADHQDVREELLDPAPLHPGDHQSPGPAAAAGAAEHGELEQSRGLFVVLRRDDRDAQGLPGPDRAAARLSFALVREIEEG